MVDILDANLRAAIENALGKAAGASITVGEMATLTQLEAPAASIHNLTGLEHATSLTVLNLLNNNISDISPLAGLNQPDGVESWRQLYFGYLALSCKHRIGKWGHG